ncbi:MAG: hypothetical protein SF069_09980 [Phycisphaerae bacterium]|nr:hypothetical protein [Phycisphaerae bacterium]
MMIDRLYQDRTLDALSLSLQFREQRHRVLAENVANIDTPNYRTKRLDTAGFEQTLKEAMDATAPDRRLQPLRGAQVESTRTGRLIAKPELNPDANALFHDGTNARLEDLMGEAATNQLEHNLVSNLLRARFDLMLTAIRGRSA